MCVSILANLWQSWPFEQAREAELVNISNYAMVGQGRTAKTAANNKQTCVWCRQSKQTLKYVLPTQNGKKEFCSEICLAEFRRAYNKVMLFQSHV